MKKSILIMIIACSTAIMANAASELAEVKSPKRLMKALTALYQKYGEAPSTQNYAKNPDTEMMEENTLIIPVKVPKNDPLLQEAISAFELDKDCGYQYFHIAPEENKGISIAINNTNVVAIKNRAEEMWMLNARNPDNPSLRDNYTLVLSNAEDTRMGKIYLVTSMRPEQGNANISPISATEDTDEQAEKYDITLEAYRATLTLINQQIADLNSQELKHGSSSDRKVLLKKLYDEAGDIIAKMKAIVDKYAETIK